MRLLPSYTLHMRVAVKVGHTHKPANHWPRAGEPNGVSAERQGTAGAQPLAGLGAQTPPRTRRTQPTHAGREIKAPGRTGENRIYLTPRHTILPSLERY